MHRLLRMVAWGMLFVGFLVVAKPVAAQDDTDEDNMCIQCHGTEDLWEGDTAHLFVGPQQLAADIHWQKGIKCQQCHGGNASSTDLREAHATENGFRKIESPSDVPDFCGHCHANAQYMGDFDPDAKTDVVERFWSSVHGKRLKNVGGDDAPSCISCHPRHQTRAVSDPLSVVSLGRISAMCGSCHHEPLTELRKSVHAKAGERNSRGAGTLMACTKCHGDDVHGMLPVDDASSPMFLDHQVRVCGDCHQEYRDTYLDSVHGKGLTDSGLLVTAACSDCHGAHGIFYAADKRSTLHTNNVGQRCGACHHFLLERLAKSVHGGPDGLGQEGERVAPGGTRSRKPTCIDCHEGHDQFVPATAAFRQELPHRCGNCHAGLSDRYRLSLHGELTEFGYEPAAECADCHGSHDIRALSDPDSPLSPEHRVKTCRQCHVNAVANFAKFDPHASYKDAVEYPWLHGWYKWFKNLIYMGVGLFVLHAIFWFGRSFAFARRNGRDRPCPADQPGIPNFATINRVIYVFLLVAFVGLVATGLPLKFGNSPGVKRLAEMIGGFQTTSVWHHFFALMLIVSCAAHLVWAVTIIFRERRRGRGWRELLDDPNSPVPNRRDFKDVRRMLKWFLGLGRKPKFERWAYWEKFDYWAVCAGVALVGLSGLMLWFPNVFCVILPGTVLNWAKVVHSEVAMAAAGFVFMIHVFNTHLRPEKFPMDVSWLSGVVAEEHLRRSRPELLRRLAANGELDLMRVQTPVPARRRQIVFWGGLVLLAGMLTLAVIVLVNLGQ